MFKSRFMKAGAIGALVTALLATSMPVQAQDRAGRDRSWGGQRAERSERADLPQRSERREARRAERRVDRQAQAPAQAAPQVTHRGNYGADTRREWRQEQRTERREDARETRRDFRQGYNAGQNADQRNNRQVYRQGYRQGQQQDWRDDRRDQRQAYHRGYRAGDRSDYSRWGGRDHRRWDNRGWRNDNRYDWHRYRAANRSIFRPGRYYAPSRGYSYSRLSIGFRLGSPFYSNRYWINDPWQYRLPPAYGSYRWVRYYDDALLVDTYSGQVVDVVHNFFW